MYVGKQDGWIQYLSMLQILSIRSALFPELSRLFINPLCIENLGGPAKDMPSGNQKQFQNKLTPSLTCLKNHEVELDTHSREDVIRKVLPSLTISLTFLPLV